MTHGFVGHIIGQPRRAVAAEPDACHHRQPADIINHARADKQDQRRNGRDGGENQLQPLHGAHLRIARQRQGGEGENSEAAVEITAIDAGEKQRQRADNPKLARAGRAARRSSWPPSINSNVANRSNHGTAAENISASVRSNSQPPNRPPTNATGTCQTRSRRTAVKWLR